MSKINRRNFIKNVGIGTTATACSLDPLSWDPMVPIEKAYPYVVQPEQVIPGVASYFATKCNQCDAGCGIVAKVREGRVIKLEGNKKEKAMSSGTICSAGTSGLLAHYSPDRYKTALKNNQVIAWEDVVTELSEAVGKGNKVGWIGRYRSGASFKVMSDFQQAFAEKFSKDDLVYWEPDGLDYLQEAVKALYGLDTIPEYKLDEVQTIVTFGADYLGTWGGTSVERGWANSRTPRGKTTKAQKESVSFSISVGPRVGITQASSDLHLLTVPGSEVGLALHIAKKIVKPGHPLKKALDGINTDTAVKDSGVKPELVDQLIAKLTLRGDKKTPLGSGKTVVLPGGRETSSQPTALAIATLIINDVLGNNNRTVVYGTHNVAGRSSGKKVVDLITTGKPDVLFIDEVDVAYSFPDNKSILEGLQSIKTLVYFTNEPNDSVLENSNGTVYIVPPGTHLERWGDSETLFGNNVLQQPVMKHQEGFSIGGTAEDLLIKMAQGNGKANPLVSQQPNPKYVPPAPVPIEEPAANNEVLSETPTDGTKDADGAIKAETAVAEVKKNPVVTPPAEPEFIDVSTPHPLSVDSFYSYLRSWWDTNVKPNNEDSHKYWIASLKLGGRFTNTAKAATLSANESAVPKPGTPSSGKVLVSFAHPRIGSGTNANRSWLQEMPDPLSTFSWATWIEVNIDTAEELGLKKNRGVTISTENGKQLVGWFGSPGIAKNTFAIVMGNGHKNSGRYAKYGSNPMELYKTRTFDEYGALSLPGITVQSVEKSNAPNSPSHQNDLLKSDTLTTNHRYVNFTVVKSDIGQSLKKWVAKANNKRHPEMSYKPSIVPEHHLPASSMAVRARNTTNRFDKTKKLTDMYPEPEHPIHRFALSIDLNKCNGCGACEAACYAENNIPVVGPDEVRMARRMSWIRLSRYWEGGKDHPEQPDVRFQPVMCQQCSHAPCEGVCPVLATYHNLDGLNAMIYNRCVGTRYCGNNCPYSARRFNYHTYRWPDSFNLMLNPEVSPREMGVMEKCNFCVQRITFYKDKKRDDLGFSGAYKSGELFDKARKIEDAKTELLRLTARLADKLEIQTWPQDIEKGLDLQKSPTPQNCPSGLNTMIQTVKNKGKDNSDLADDIARITTLRDAVYYTNGRPNKSFGSLLNMTPEAYTELLNEIKFHSDYESSKMVESACAQACPSQSIKFGNLNNPYSNVHHDFESERSYRLLNELNTKPGVTYLARVVHSKPAKH